jgi:cell division protein FtsQ
MNDYANNRRDQRFFTGDQGELQEIKNKESLQKFVRHNQAKKSFFRLTYIIIFIVLTALFVIVCLAVFFKVKEVEIVGTSHYSNEDILQFCRIETGQSLYEVNNDDLAGLSDKFAYIKSAKITRKLPHTLIITITEDEACYYCELYGEYFIMSKDLRVLDRAFDSRPLIDQGLIELVLPETDKCIIGQSIVFSNDSDAKYVFAYLDALYTSTLYTSVTAFDLRDKFNLQLICDSIYLVELADGDDLLTKLSATAQVLATDAFNDKIPAKIDVTDPAEISAVINNNVNVTFY